LYGPGSVPSSFHNLLSLKTGENAKAVLRIRDVYPGSLSRIFIPDPNFFHPGSASKNLSIFNAKKLFPSSRKYDPGCSSRIRISDLDFLPIPDPGVKKAPDPRTRIRNTEQKLEKKKHFILKATKEKRRIRIRNFSDTEPDPYQIKTSPTYFMKV
jgi:hypothetical protein